MGHMGLSSSGFDIDTHGQLMRLELSFHTWAPAAMDDTVRQTNDTLGAALPDIY